MIYKATFGAKKYPQSTINKKKHAIFLNQFSFNQSNICFQGQVKLFRSLIKLLPENRRETIRVEIIRCTFSYFS